MFSRKLQSYLRAARVGRLATVNENGTSNLVPIVFANDSKQIFFVIDKKRKGRRLQRIENIKRTGSATLLVDNYSENWDQLSFVMIRVNAMIVRTVSEKQRATRLLKSKYPQYSDRRYFPDRAYDATFVKLVPIRIAQWSQKLRESVI